MKIDGVNFNEELVKKMSKKQFIDQNKDVFYTDLSSEQREMKLGDIYDRIKGRLTGTPSL